ncbi:MAG TPA: type III secretion system effector protein [Pyrinomonadaceae bacterium]
MPSLSSIKQTAKKAASKAMNSLPRTPPSPQALCPVAGAAFGPLGLGALVAGAAAVYGAKKLLAKVTPKTETYAKGVKIKGSPAFIKDTKASLDRLKATPTGKSLLTSLGNTGKTTTITEFGKNNGTCRPLSPADAVRTASGKAGKGSDSIVQFNPKFKPGGLPNEVVLGHELIHAQHNATGTRETGLTKGVKNEELRTSGLPPYPSTGLTENALRKDLKQPKRTKY